MIDHVTYEIDRGGLEDPDLGRFFAALDLLEVEPDGAIEKDWNVRWWSDEDGKTIHLVEGERPVTLGLAHFCIKGVGEKQYTELQHSEWLEHDSGSGRIWLSGPQGLRVEVHA